MDGTIIDTEHIWERATTELIESKGVRYTQELREELNKHIHGLALVKSCQLIKDMFQLPHPVEELIVEKGTRANNLYKENVIFIEGFTDFIDKVMKHDLKRGIATNADADTVAITNQKLNLERYFGQHIYNVSHVQNRCKPDPALYLHASEKLEIEPRDCIVIEDSAHGIEAAKKAGMVCIGINTSKKPDQLKKADMIIDGYAELDLKKLL